MRMLETSLEKLARILSRQYQVDIVFEGQQASTNGKVIYLPYFPEITEELELDLNGYLDHEVSHIKFTHFPESKEVLNSYHHQLLNAVEDVRIERLMIAEYPGTRYHLDSLNRKLIDKLKKTWFNMPWSVRFILATSFTMTGEELIEDKEVQYYLDLCKAEIDTLNDCESTKDLRLVTEKMVKKLLKDLSEEEKKKKEEQGEGGEGDDEGEEGQESDKSSGKGRKNKSSKSKSGEGDDKEIDEDGEGSKSGSSKKDGKKGKGKPTKADGDNLVKSKNDGDFEQYEIDIHRLIQTMIHEKAKADEKQLDEAKSYGYDYHGGNKTVSVPLTTKYDTVHQLSGKNKNNEYSGIRAKVKPLVNTLKMNLEKIFKSIENARWKGEREQGLINARSLATLSSNPNYRGVFKEMVKTETDKVAISILIDLSGSMYGAKVETAKLSATAMAEALNGLGISFEVLGFNTGSSSALSSYVRSQKIDSKRFNRYDETLEHFVFKDFNSISLTGLSNIQANGANADGESVMWAAKRLAERKEKRKILIVMSDGMPSCGGDHRILQSDLRVKLAQIEKYGIETVGIGIQTDAVKHFYKDYLVINNLKDLTTTSLKKLESILLKGLRK